MAWKIRAVILTVFLASLFFDVLAGNARFAIGDAALAAAVRMDMRHPPSDPDGPWPSSARIVTIAALSLTGLVLLLIP
jgi:hypothetical protein